MTHRPRFSLLLAAALALAVRSGAAARGQEPEPLRLQGLVPGGVRTSATESWGAFHFTILNRNPEGRDARVLVFYPESPDVQYGRDVWVPGRSTLSSWMLVGPAPERPGAMGRTIDFLLYDRTGGQQRLLLPSGDERVRSRAVPYRRREPTTAILLDEVPTEGDELIPRARRDMRADQALVLARTFRQDRALSERITIIRNEFLAPTPEAFDGIDHFVLAGNRLAADPPGRQALRRWVQQGGTLWVMLDLVDPDVVAPVLGEDLDFHVVDRLSLTTIRLHRPADDPATIEVRELEQPVEFVRVALAGAEKVLHAVNGWPASFIRPVGRGKVVFTTLGARGWYRPRTAGDPPSPFEHYPDQPVALVPLEQLALELQPRSEPGRFHVEDLRPLLSEEIGYAVVGRSTAGLIFGAFLAAVLALGLGLRGSRRPELVGWLGPAAAVAAAGLFVVLGQASRRAVPPTVGVAELVNAAPGSGEAAVSGLFAVYCPDSGTAPLGTDQGGILELDAAGLEGQMQRRVLTDLDVWHWENLALPAGVRLGPFRATARTGPVAAVARFGPAGVAGRLATGRFREPADAVLITPARESVALQLGADGTFTAGSADVLPPDQYLAGAVLTDRQQQRQVVYRKLLTNPMPTYLEDRDLLLTWAEPGDVPFTAEAGARTVGTALLVIPLEFERPPGGTRVIVPRGFVPCRRIFENSSLPPVLESTAAADMHLRFQVPPSVLPLEVERVTLFAKVRIPARRFALAGHADGKRVPLYTAESPFDFIRLEIADARVLRLDERGGLHLNLAVSDRLEAGGRAKDLRQADLDAMWRIESLSLEVMGRTSADQEK